jgi:hypothetical protein
MNGLHQQRKGAEREFALSGQQGLHNYGKSPQLQACHRAYYRGCYYPLRASFAADYRLVHKGVGDKAGIYPQVPDIAAKREEAAISKEKSLYRQYRSHNQESGIWPEYNRKDHTPSQVPARTCAGDRKIDHLGREYKSPQHAHKRDYFFINIFPELSGAIR